MEETTKSAHHTEDFIMHRAKRRAQEGEILLLPIGKNSLGYLKLSQDIDRQIFLEKQMSSGIASIHKESKSRKISLHLLHQNINTIIWIGLNVVDLLTSTKLT